MKHVLIFCLLLWSLSGFALAAPYVPLTESFPYADSVYLVHVDATAGKKVNFSVIETLRGRSLTALSLDVFAPPAATEFKKDSEWLVLSCPSWRKAPYENVVVTSNFYGYPGWACNGVRRIGNEIYVGSTVWHQNSNIVDKAPDGTQAQDDKTPDGRSGLTLDHIKRLLRDNPERQEPK